MCRIFPLVSCESVPLRHDRWRYPESNVSKFPSQVRLLDPNATVIRSARELHLTGAEADPDHPCSVQIRSSRTSTQSELGDHTDCYRQIASNCPRDCGPSSLNSEEYRVSDAFRKPLDGVPAYGSRFERDFHNRELVIHPDTYWEGC